MSCTFFTRSFCPPSFRLFPPRCARSALSSLFTSRHLATIRGRYSPSSFFLLDHRHYHSEKAAAGGTPPDNQTQGGTRNKKKGSGKNRKKITDPSATDKKTSGYAVFLFLFARRSQFFRSFRGLILGGPWQNFTCYALLCFALGVAFSLFQKNSKLISRFPPASLFSCLLFYLCPSPFPLFLF